MQLFPARHPAKLQAERPILVEEFLELTHQGKRDALRTMIDMLKALRDEGRDCRFLKKLKYGPMWELKPATRGGEKGGARVYLFLLATHDQAGLVNCEVKGQDEQADPGKLKVGLQVVQAHNKGINVFKEPIHVENVEDASNTTDTR